MLKLSGYYRLSFYIPIYLFSLARAFTDYVLVESKPFTVLATPLLPLFFYSQFNTIVKLSLVYH